MLVNNGERYPTGTSKPILDTPLLVPVINNPLENTYLQQGVKETTSQDLPQLDASTLCAIQEPSAPTLRTIQALSYLGEQCLSKTQDWPGSLGKTPGPKYQIENQLVNTQTYTANNDMTNTPKCDITNDCFGAYLEQSTANAGEEVAIGQIFEVPDHVPESGSTTNPVEGSVDPTEGYRDSTWILVKRKK